MSEHEYEVARRGRTRLLRYLVGAFVFGYVLHEAVLLGAHEWLLLGVILTGVFLTKAWGDRS